MLSGAMTFLWGMLNCLQIVALFYLVNVNMPSNATQLFKIIVSIATFDIIPSRTAISDIEDSVQIVNDDFILTESFKDFEYDSSGPIRNMQILFFALLVLALLPVILVLLKGAFFWHEKCRQVVN